MVYMLPDCVDKERITMVGGFFFFFDFIQFY